MKRTIFYTSLLLMTPAVAETGFPHGLSVGLGASVLGGINVSAGFYNPDYESYWLRHLGVRIDFATTDPLKSAINSVIDSYMRDGRDVGDGVKIDNGSLDAWHTSILVDYYPFVGAWRVSAGRRWTRQYLGKSPLLHPSVSTFILRATTIIIMATVSTAPPQSIGIGMGRTLAQALILISAVDSDCFWI